MEAGVADDFGDDGPGSEEGREDDRGGQPACDREDRQRRADGGNGQDQGASGVCGFGGVAGDAGGEDAAGAGGGDEVAVAGGAEAEAVGEEEEEDGERCHGDGSDQVGGEHQRAAFVAVGEDPAEGAECDLGEDPGAGGQPDPDRGVSAVVDEREQREVVEPVTGLGGGQARQQQTEAPLARSRSSAPQRRRRAFEFSGEAVEFPADRRSRGRGGA